jgi:integrase
MHRQVSWILKEVGNPATVDQRTLDDAVLAIHRRWTNPSTAKRIANNLRAVVNVGQRYGLLPKDLVLDMPKAQVRRREPLTPAQIQTVRDGVAGTKHELPTLVLIHCGLRGFGKELESFTLNHEDQTITARSSKGGVVRERRVPLPHHLYDRLSTVGEGFTAHQVRDAGIFWTKNFKGMQPYQLRHSYATRLLSSGVPITTVQYLMGHASVTTTMTYSHVTADDISSARAFA